MIPQFYTARQIADAINIHPESVKKRARRLGITGERVGQTIAYSAQERERIIQNETPAPRERRGRAPQPDMLTTAQAARRIPVSSATFAHRARELGIEGHRDGELIFWTLAQVGRVRFEYPTFVKKQREKRSASQPASSQPVSQSAATYLEETHPAGARYLRHTDAPQPYDWRASL